MSQKTNSLSSVDNFLLYNNNLTSGQQRMTELTISFIYSRLNEHLYTIHDNDFNNPIEKVSINYFNTLLYVIDKYAPWLQIVKNDDSYGYQLINKSYADSENIMEIIARSVYDKISEKTIASQFRNFIKSLPHERTPSVIAISNTFLARQITSSFEEGASWNISSAHCKKNGEIYLTYITAYTSKKITEWDALFIKYFYSKLYVIINGFGMFFDEQVWREKSEEVCSFLGEKITSIKSTELYF